MASPSFRSVILSASFPSSRTVDKFVRFLIPQLQAGGYFPRPIQGNQAMSVVRRLAKSGAVLRLGKKPSRTESPAAWPPAIASPFSPTEMLSYLLGGDEPHWETTCGSSSPLATPC